MAFKQFSDVRETSTTGGTGNQVLAGKFDNSYFEWSDRYSDQDTFFYCMKQGTSREIGLGTWNSGADSITRTQVYKSTNSNNLVNFTNGQTIDMFVTEIAPSDLDAAGLALITAASVSSASSTVAGRIEIADATEMEAGSAADRAVPPSLQHRHPGHPKAWCRFNGSGTPAFTESYNCSSITDNGTGDWTINLTTSFAGSTPAAIASLSGTNSSGLNDATINVFTASASAVRIRVHDVGAAALADADGVAMVAFGDQT